MNVTIIDNYDSFTHNLAHAVAALGATVTVHRNDAVSRERLADDGADGVILSPGPGHPGDRRDFGVCTDLVHDPLPAPMLGVCLGMQGMALHTGGHVLPAPQIVHGEATRFEPTRHALFAGLPKPLVVGRYHSLAVDPDRLPTEWEPLGSTDDGTLMAMAHRQRPWFGVQFHPESILTPEGPRLLQNFLEMCT